MNSKPNREVRGPHYDEQATTGLEHTLKKTPTGRAFARTPEGQAAIRRERNRRGLNITGGAFDSAAPVSPAPVQTAGVDDGRPVALMPSPPVVSDVKVGDTRSPYGPNSPHGYFADLIRLAAADAANQRWIDNAQRHMVGQEPGLPVFGQGTLDDARRRVLEGERRDVTSASGGAGFTTTAWFGPLFDSAARAEGRIRDLVTVRDMPEKGMTVRVPRLTTGTDASVQAGENQAVTEDDPVSVAVDGEVITLAGMVDVSQELLERSGGLADEALGRDLAEELARVLDLQVIDGSGSAGQMTGLLQTSDITTTTYTEGSPTVAEWRAARW